MASMFTLDNVNQYVVYLAFKNSNIDWVEFFNNNIGHNDKYILKRIRSLLWVDKSVEYTNTYHNEYWFRYYTHLLSAYDLTEYIGSSKHLYILDMPDDLKGALDWLVSAVADKLSVLKRLLQMLDIQYTCIHSLDVKNDALLIPTASILYPGITPLYNSIIHDSLNNICANECELVINRFKIIIDMLCDTSNNLEDILSCDFGFIMQNL